MVEHAVHNDPHASAVDLLHKLGEKLIAGLKILRVSRADSVSGSVLIVCGVWLQRFPAVFNDAAVVGINMIIILGIVLVIRRRDKQRIKIDDLHPQPLKIIQLVPHSLQISAIKTSHVHGGWVLTPILHLTHRSPDIYILAILDVIRSIPIAEAIHKDLVHDRSLDPLRCVKAWRYTVIKALLGRLAYSQAVIITGLLAFHHPKTVSDLSVRHLFFIFVVVKQIVRLCLYKRFLLLHPFFLIIYMIYVIPGSPKPQSNNLSRVRLRGDSKFFILIRKQGLSVDRFLVFKLHISVSFLI